MNYLDFWYQAATAEFGICIETTNVESVRQQLYQARKGADDPTLDGLSVRQSPINPNHLWIFKTAKKNPPGTVELKI